MTIDQVLNALLALGFILAIAAPLIWLVWKLNPNAVRHMLGIVVIRDQDDIAIRNAVSQACKAVPVRNIRIEEAEAMLEEAARHAIARHFADANPGKTFKVTPNWPDAKCVISGNIAVVRPILGHDYMNDHDGIRAVNFEIDRESRVLQLRPWAPKQPEPAPNGKPEPKQNPAPQRQKPGVRRL